MKREVKFRVWVAAYEEMCYDAGITQHPDTKTPEYFYLLPNGETRGRFVTGDWECPDHVWEQFTGLKDSQGKDIYEGDILQSANVDYAPIAVVVYVDYEARFAPCEAESYLMGKRDGDLFNQPGEPWMLHACRVIGNIHENSELLKT